MTTPFYEDNHIKLYNKDCRQMTELANESVQCVVCSPPYWGLRRYSGEQELVWGGDNCEHQWVEDIKPDDAGQGHYTGRTRWQHIAQEAQDKGIPVREVEPTAWAKGGFKASFCSLCGAWRGAYGLEPTPEMYVQHTIEILREIRRVLRKDGVVFWNIGDSYNSAQSGYGEWTGEKARQGDGEFKKMGMTRTGVKHKTIKPKDLCLIPFRIAIAAQEDGWWLRSVIIWNKSNPMPESVTDRPTESHEYILMLTKSGTPQYWTHRDGGGAREKPKADYRWVNQQTQEEVATEPPDWKVKILCPECEGKGIISVYLGLDVWQETKCPTCNGKKKTQLWKRINLWRGHDYYWDADAVREEYTEPMNRWGGETLKRDTSKTAAYKEMQNIGYSSAFRVGRPMRPDPSGRNIRSVWEFPTTPFPKAHFAVFPEKLPELCIKAATSEIGCCSKCGAPWTRVIKKGFTDHDGATRTAYPEGSSAKRLALLRQAARQRGAEYQNISETIEWQPTCKCNAARVPSLVLDPFAGAGTTLWVAKRLNRQAVGYEISGEYCQLAVERCRQQVML